MTSIARFLVAALVLALLSGPGASLAAASAPPPAKKQAAGKHAKKKAAKKKQAARKKKARKKARAKRPAPRPQTRPQPQPAPQPLPTPQPTPQPQPTPTPPAGQAEQQFNVAASGSYRYLYEVQGPSHSTRAEQTLSWNAAGLASVGRGATDTDFRITTHVLNGFLANYRYERGSSSNGCSSGYAEVAAATHIPVSVGLGGTSRDNLRAGLGDGYFDIVASETASGPCASLPPRTWTQVFRFSGLAFSFRPLAPPEGDSACANTGSLASGLFRTCVGIVKRGTVSTETWTMSVKLTPV